MARVEQALKTLGAGALATLGIAACADVFGVRNADVDASFADTGLLDAPDDYVTHDAIDLDVNTAVCEGGVALVADDEAVWVSGTGQDGASCGTPASPCATIGHALSVRGTRAFLYLDHATFTEALSLGGAQAGVTIQGGFERGDAGWSPQCDNSLSTIQAPDDAGPSAIDIDGAAGVTLRLVTVRSKTNGALGESVYAVRVFDTSGVVLDNVSLLAQSGGQGVNGQAGVTPTTCVGLASGSSAAGSTGQAGAPGSIGPTGYTIETGANGLEGGVGNATAGSAGQCGFCVSCQ